MNKIAVITATRAEYGLLLPVIQELRKYENNEFTVDLIVTGTHLSEKYGFTIREIEQDGLRIDYKIVLSVKAFCEADISYNQAEALVKFTQLFVQKRYDAVVLLGDRYETLAIAIAAGNTRTPIFHLCGGDTTEGAMDEWIRHAITKVSYLHFVTNEESYRRVLQLGEQPERVFNYGFTGIDNILRKADLSKKEALASIGLEDCSYALCTYHPVTMENNDVDVKMYSFLEVIKEYSKIQFIVTKSNADNGGARINEILDAAALEIPNLHVYSSLGIRRYLSLMKYALFVFGNSSSGIGETPAFGIPTVNIGDRQKGRLRVCSIIDCADDKESICMAIEKALDEEFRNRCKQVVSPYGNGNAGQLIAKEIVYTLIEKHIDLKKKFYDLKV